MGTARWKRRLLVVLVGVVVGLGGVGDQPAAYADGGRHAREQRCGDCYERPARDYDCYRERPCAEGGRERRCADCYERPAGDDCYRERPCAENDCDGRDEKDGRDKKGGDQKSGDQKSGDQKSGDQKSGDQKGGRDEKGGDEKEKDSRLRRLLRGIFD